jgi:hypothetical protein
VLLRAAMMKVRRAKRMKVRATVLINAGCVRVSRICLILSRKVLTVQYLPQKCFIRLSPIVHDSALVPLMRVGRVAVPGREGGL